MALPTTTGRGFVIAEVELSFLPNGNAVANFPVAFKDSKKLDDGTFEDVRNTVYRMTAWGKLAEQIADSVLLKTDVDISFRAYEDTYQDKQTGEDRKSLKGTVVSCSPSIERRGGNSGGGQGGGSRQGGSRQGGGGGSRQGGFGSNPASQNPSNGWGDV